MDRQHYRDIKSRAHGAMQAILAVATAQGRAPTVEEQAAFDGHKATILDADRAIQMMDDSDAIGAQLNAVAPSRIGAPSIRGPEAVKSFETFGEFMHAVRFNPNDQRLSYGSDPRSEMSMGVDTKGGFAVPKVFVDEMLQVRPDEAIFRPRARVLGAGSPPDAEVTIPALDQSGTTNIHGGVTVTWIGEGAAKPATDANLREVTLKPHEVAAHVVVTDKLLRNWGAAGGLISTLLQDAIVSAEEQAFLTGTGVGRPLGVLHASNAGAIAVNRSAANKITYADVVALIARAKLGGPAAFVASQGVLPQLMVMKDEAGQLIWQPSAREGELATLLGRPLLLTPHAPALGARGDLALLDLSYYLIKDGSGVFVSASEHVHFVNNKTVIKAFWNVDGKPWVTKPLPYGASTVSPFTILDVPA